MNFKLVNNITGWTVCIIACLVYILTAEAGASLWDCGEFVSSAFKVQIPHPPGAPLFVLLGRFFVILFGDNPMTAAKAVNIMNALASGFTILFLFWTITHFARRIVCASAEVVPSKSQIISIMGAGIVGALAYTFSDSFWYSAVEGEVYALSSFFTALVFWAILRWEHRADEPGIDRWIVFIFFMMGLSIGVHLLNLLTIPAIVMVYYFRKRTHFNYPALRKFFIRFMVVAGIIGFIGGLWLGNAEANPDRNIPSDNTYAGLMLFGAAIAIGLLYFFEGLNKKEKSLPGGAYIFFVLGVVLTGVVQVGVIQYSIKTAGTFDRIFVNSFGLPFFSGFIFFFVLIAALCWYLIRFAAKKGWPFLRLAVWCFAFMLIGYSTYITTMIRSSADPAIDMYNVDNPMSLVGYLGREQYGDFPLLYGQKFTATPVDISKGSIKWQKGDKKYIEQGRDMKYVYLPEDKMVFPRVWDASNEQAHADYYAMFLGIGKNQDGSYVRDPNFGDNIKFFVGYQNYFMYLRYFFWNFAGKQNDVQGLFLGNVTDGNWITGIGFIDKMLYGDQSLMQDSLKNNKANNKLFALPFILGMIGLFYHFKTRKDDAVVSMLLFFFTGFAIVLYLNQAGMQPRERDYAYVGSFYAFAIWIGIGVLKVKDWLSKAVNINIAAGLATVICTLAVPVVMAGQEWDDHDRSKKQLARDLAKNYLESCAPNAILFTFGDNDTYPLWYAQEVEGIRPDIRVINTSLLGIDWYINQLRYKINQSDAIDVVFDAAQIEGRKREYVIYKPNSIYPAEQYSDLYTVMKDYVGSDDPRFMEQRSGDELYNTFPTKRFSVPVNKEVVMKNGTVNPTDEVVDALQFEVSRNGLLKNDLTVLNIIAANQWKRPIYFTMPSADLGFDHYLRKDGLTYRLVPVANDPVNTNWMLDKLMNKFAFGGANIPGVYFDEENRRHLNTIRNAYAELAGTLADQNRKQEAIEVLDKADKNFLQENFPYAMGSRGNIHNQNSLRFLIACYKAGHITLAKKVADAVKKDVNQRIRFIDALPPNKAEWMAEDRNICENLLRYMDQIEQTFNPKLAPAQNILPSTPPAVN